MGTIDGQQVRVPGGKLDALIKTKVLAPENANPKPVFSTYRPTYLWGGEPRPVASR